MPSFMIRPPALRLRLPLILASSSPRRRDLLAEAGIEARVVPADGVEEAHDPMLSSAELTCHNATMKAVEVARRFPGALVLGADTLVYLGEEPLGKPRDPDEARTMLRRLSGRTHTVCTGVCLASGGGREAEVFHDLTQVTFRDLDEGTIGEYLRLVDVLDKAGAYAIQEHGSLIVAGVDGSLSNVVGLPVEALVRRLDRWVVR